MAAQNGYGLFPLPFRTDILALCEAEGKEVAPVTGANCDLVKLMPACSRSKMKFPSDSQQPCGMEVIKRAEITIEFLENELSVPRLNDIHEHLWLAGRPIPARPLNYQVASSRTITITEDIHLHLVWEPGRMFIKPLPRYLLSSAFWTEHLVCLQQQNHCSCYTNQNSHSGNPLVNVNIQCKRRELYKCAYGLLLTYTSLIQYESDYHIAKDQHLLPDGVEWESWRKLSWELLEHSPLNTSRANKRYQFGELRLGRLNKIIRVRGLAGRGFEDLVRGYRLGYATFGQQLNGFLTPILAATAYILLVLTAMQVGLGTNTLQKSLLFQRASYGFTVFSIIAPLILITISTFIVLLFAVFNYLSTKNYLQKRIAFYTSLEY